MDIILYKFNIHLILFLHYRLVLEKTVPKKNELMLNGIQSCKTIKNISFSNRVKKHHVKTELGVHFNVLKCWIYQEHLF